jgi:hypothetical protein
MKICKMLCHIKNIAMFYIIAIFLPVITRLPLLCLLNRGGGGCGGGIFTFCFLTAICIQSINNISWSVIEIYESLVSRLGS